MTFRERFYKDYPEEAADPAEFICPSVCGYEEDWDCESSKNTEVTSCDECWDREIPDQRPDPHFNIEIEQIRQSSNWKQDNDRWLEYLERLFNFKENGSRCTFEVTTEGLNREERAILFDVMERALRRIRHQRRRDGRPDVQCQAVLK